MSPFFIIVHNCRSSTRSPVSHTESAARSIADGAIFVGEAVSEEQDQPGV